MIQTFCNNVTGVFTYCEPVAAIYTHCGQVWPTSSTVGAWYVKWQPNITAGSFKMFDEYYSFSEHSSVYRWNGEGWITGGAFSTVSMNYMKTNVLGISMNAFYSCKQLEQISLPRCEYVGIGAFSACTSLYGTGLSGGRGYLYLPQCTHISSHAFYADGKIYKLNAPVCVSIGSSAFRGTNINGISLPRCEYVGSYAFYRCDLQNVSLPKCEYVGSYAFCSNDITNVYLPKCSYIGARAFDYNANYSPTPYSTLKTLNLPECKYIGSSAFIGHVNLSNVVLYKCSYIGSDAFRYCGIENMTITYSGVCRLSYDHITKNISYICVPPSLVSNYKRDTIWNYYADKIRAIGEVGSYSVNWTPSSMSGVFKIANCDCSFASFSGSYAWTESFITNNAFESTSITWVGGPSISQINGEAFRDCTSLTSARFPKCKVVGHSAFQGCSMLSMVFMPVCVDVVDCAFMNCTSLRYIDLPSCLYVESSAFMNCIAMSQANLPSCGEVDERAFYGCTSLKRLLNISKCYDVGVEAFCGCTSLESIHLSMNDLRLSLTHIIQSSAFKNCTALSYVYLGDVSIIEKDVFYNCTNLSQLAIDNYGVPELMDSRAFEGTSFWNGEGVIYVHETCWSSILSASNWSYYSSLMVSVSSIPVM